MKIVRFGDAGEEKPGLIDHEGRIRDLSNHFDDWHGDTLSPENLRSVSNLSMKNLPVVAPEARLGPPICGVRQIIGIGLNYRAHAEEAGLAIPDEPAYFMKAISSISGPFDPISIPYGSEKVDWEVELGVVIGSRCSYVDEVNAADHIAGFLTANDVSERGFQLERGTQWTKGKSCEGFAPIGPWLVTKDDIPDPNQLDLKLWLNGALKQSSNSSDMVFSVVQLVSYVSQFMVLLPGDIILTGTPSGVGFGLEPQRFIKAGDRIRAEIVGLGAQEYSFLAN